MKVLAIAVFSFLASTSTIQNASAQTITLVQDGKSRYSIVLAPGAADSLMHGAEEIQRYLKEITGAELPIIAPKAGKVGLPRFVVRIDTDPKLGEEELRVRTVGSSLRISGGGKRGALYGCYAFLGDILGCQWYNQRVSAIPKSSWRKPF